MTSFPVTASTLSATALCKLVKEKYQLTEDFKCLLYRTGINHTYFIKNKHNTYVLRVYCYNWRTKQEILEELKLLELLKDNQHSVSYALTDKNKNFIQQIQAPEGIRYAVLFSFAEGGKVRFLDHQTTFAIGALMGEIHNTTVNKTIARVNYTTETLTTKPYSFTLKYFDAKLPEMEYIREVGKKVEVAFKNKKIPEGIIHLDIWYDNMAITDNRKITIFDFDFCGNGYLVLDVAYFCAQLFHIETDKEAYKLKIKEFLKGYQTKTKLSKTEIDLIPIAATAVWLFYLGVQSQRFDWSNIFLTENYLKMYLGRLKNWMNFCEENPNTFTL
ncbi:homoserine kinase [Cellulophaga lytica]|uniref:phosphotransferase n=1 Tax=Cellulophaga lytica TaxID=979 RepID=UPI0009506FB0|nr:phosphotransferase [Cellulophaga lytica]APU10069.1 homoserine kinase [Cellulophaga lytica]